jgi:hypothetical protein
MTPWLDKHAISRYDMTKMTPQRQQVPSEFMSYQGEVLLRLD